MELKAASVHALLVSLIIICSHSFTMKGGVNPLSHCNDDTQTSKPKQFIVLEESNSLFSVKSHRSLTQYYPLFGFLLSFLWHILYRILIA